MKGSVEVCIGTSSPVTMAPDEARSAVKRHLQGSQFRNVALDDERWLIEIETMGGKKARILFPDFGGDPIRVLLS